MKTKMNLRWRWLLGLSLMLCWLGGSGPNAVQAQESVRMAADKMVAPAAAQSSVMAGMKAMVAPMPETPAPATVPGKEVASMPTADLPTVKVAQYRRGRKSALTDTVRFTAVWAAGPEDAYPFAMLLVGEGECVIDWGDGTRSSCLAAKNNDGTDYVWMNYQHPYASAAEDDERKITVYTSSPDLHIVGLQLYYYTNYDVYTLHRGVDVRFCPSLKYLYCGGNWLGTLDLTQNTVLTELECTYCRLTSLALPQSAALKVLKCGGNQLTSLDVSGYPGLTQLYCWSNQLTSLDVSASTALTGLYCYRNQLTSLNLPQTETLTVLSVGGNQLTSLGVSGYPALRQLYCWGNQLTALDLSQNTFLDTLECQSNQLGWADLETLSQLDYSYLIIAPQELPFEAGLNEAVDLSAYMTYKGQQTVCDFSAMPASVYTFENDVLKINRAGTFTVSMTNPAVKRNGESLPINCNVSVGAGVSDTVRWVWQQSGINYVNLTIAGDATSIIMDWGDGTIETEAVASKGSRQIRHTYAEAGKYTVKIWGDNQWMLSGLEFVSGSHVQSLDLSDCPYLERLVCFGNDLTALDLSACVSLKSLNCYGNKLSSLDVTQNIALTFLNCNDNQLTVLDLANNVNLTSLGCSNNRLTSLDVSHNTELVDLYSPNNQFGWATLDALSQLEGSIVISPQVLPSLEVNLDEAVDLSAYASYNGQQTVFDLGEYTSAAAYTIEGGILKIKIPGSFTVHMTNPAVTLKNEPVVISRDIIAWSGASDTLRWVWTVEDVSEPAELSYFFAMCDSSFIIDWGDGQKDTGSMNMGLYYSGKFANSYAKPGEYKVTVYGLKHFMPSNFQLGNSHIKALDVRDCPGLTTLQCSGNQLTELDLSNNAALSGLYVDNNQLTSLDLSACPSLEVVYCGSNGLTELDVTKNTALWYLSCGFNELTELDVTKNTALKNLSCYGNQLTELDVTKNTALKTLSCYGNQLMELDVTKNEQLKELECSSNQLTELDVTENTALEGLDCSGNELTSLDVSQNLNLNYLYCQDNRLTSLNTGPHTAFATLYCSYNQLGWATLDALSQLEGGIVISPQRLPSMEVGLNEPVDLNEYTLYKDQQTVFSLGENTPASAYTIEEGILKIKRVGSYTVTMSNPGVTLNGKSVFIERAVAVWPATSDTVRWVWQHPASIEYVDLQMKGDAKFMVDWGDGQVDEETVYDGFRQIRHTYAEEGEYNVTIYGTNHWMLLKLTLFDYSYVQSLDVSACPCLESLKCEGNQLTSLDVSKNTALTELVCSDNQLTSLDVTKNTALMSLTCTDNQLTELNLSNNTALTGMYVDNNQLTSLDVSACPSLEILYCNNNQLTELNISACPSLEILYCNNNQLTELNISACPSINYLACYYNQLGWADLDALSKLDCDMLYISPQELPSKEVKVNEEVDLSEYASYNDNQTVFECRNASVSDYTVENGMVTFKRPGEYRISMSNPGVTLNDESVFIECAITVAPGASDTLRWVWEVVDLENQNELTYLYAMCDASFIIDWGDGQKQEMEMSEWSSVEHVTHDYATLGDYTVTVYGLKHFSPLIFQLGGNHIKALDVSACPSLETLQCSDNQLTELDLSNNPALGGLYVDWNQLTSLDVSACPSLEILYCSSNRLTSLDVAQKTALTHLSCGDNKLTSLDVTGCTALKDISCYRNQLTSLDLSQSTALTRLECGSNQLASLDLPQDAELEYVNCGGNKLSFNIISSVRAAVAADAETYGFSSQTLSYKVGVRSPLVELPMIDGTRASVEVRQYDVLEEGTDYEIREDGGVYVNNAGTYTLKVWHEAVKEKKSEGAEEELYVSNATVEVYEAYDMAAWTWRTSHGENTKTFSFSGTADGSFMIDWGDGTQQEVTATGRVKKYDHTYNVAAGAVNCMLSATTAASRIKELNYNDNQLTALDVRECEALTGLACSGNRLTALDVSKNKGLENLSCGSNQLTELNVSKNKALMTLTCAGNQLTSLDVSACVELFALECYSNQLTELDVTACPELDDLQCYLNELTELDLSNNTVLTWLECGNNQLTELDVTKNTALELLSCYGNQLTTLDVSRNTKLEKLLCGNNQLTELDVTKNALLTRLSCGNNQLTSLDLSKNMALKSLNCDHNRLSALNLLWSVTLDELSCANNALPFTALTNIRATQKFLSPQSLFDTIDVQDGITLPVVNGTRVNVEVRRGDELLTEGKGYTVRLDSIFYKLYFTQAGDYRLIQWHDALLENYYDGEALATRVYHDTTAVNVTGNDVPDPVDGYDLAVWTWTKEGNGTLETSVLFAGTPGGSFVIDWGDGERVRVTATGESVNYTHIYNMAAQGGSTDTVLGSGRRGQVEWQLYATTPASRILKLQKVSEVGLANETLDVRGCPELTYLAWVGCENCGGGLTALDVSQNLKLEQLYCYYNQLTALDVTRNTALKAFSCEENLLTSVGMPQGVKLDAVYFGGNRIPFAALTNISATQKYLWPQSLFDTIEVQDGITLPMVNGTRVNVEVRRGDELLTEGKGYTVRLDSVFYKLYFTQAGDYRLIQWHDAFLENFLKTNPFGDLASYERVYHDTTLVTVTGNNVPDPVDDYDLAVWTWTKEGNGALETNVSFAGTEGGSFVIDWGDGVKEAVEGTGERVKYTHIYDGTAQVGPADTVFGLGRTGQVEWQLYATTPASRILELVKVSEVGLSNETLDVSGCPELTILAWVGSEDCGGSLTALDVSHNLKLEKLSCHINRLTSLDVTRNTALTSLSCSYNPLMSLDVTKNAKLESLWCYDNRLTALDVTRNTALTLLSCGGNQLTSLDVTKNTALASLLCHENRLTSLDVTQNTALTSLYCYDNRLTSLDVSRNTALLELYCGNNLLTSLDVTQNVMLESLNCYGDPLTSLDVTKNTALTFLNCRYNQLTSLDLTQNLMLETLYCGDNELTSLEVSQNTALALLSCNHNQLTSLDVSDCMALEVLICNHNQLTALNLPQDAKLETLACDSNAMPLSVLATFKDVEAACLSPQNIARETQPGKVLDLRSEMRIGATQTVYTVLKDGKPVDSTAYTMNADGVYGQLRFKTPGQYRLSLSNAEVTEIYTVLDSGYYNLNETPQPVYVYYDITVEQPIVQGSGAGWMWLASAGAEKRVTFKGSAEGFRIDWGDESSSDVESGLATHRYAEGGIYTVKIESLSNEGRLTSLDVSNGGVAMIWFEDASKLTSLNCADNQLTSVDLSAMPNLKDYNCARNLFTSLDLTSLAQLQTVDFSGNQLTAVSLPTHSNLKAVKGADNRMRLSTLYGLLSQRVEKASYGFDPQSDSVYVPAGNILDLSAEMNIGGNKTTYVVSDAEGRPVQTSEYAETNGSFRFTEAGHRYKVTLMNMSVMEYQNGNPQKPVTFVLNVIVPGVGNEELTGSDACVYVRNRTICLSEDLGEMCVYTTLGRCIYKGKGLEAEVPCAGLYVVQAGGHTWKVVVR